LIVSPTLTSAPLKEKQSTETKSIKTSKAKEDEVTPKLRWKQ